MIFIKKCAAIQLAHLYEHLFCMAVQDFFYNKKLFPYLDYALKAYTLNKGIIYIELSLYTKEAKSVAQGIPSLKLEFDNDTLLIAAAQIIAEKEKSVAAHSLEELQSALITIDKEPWIEIDNVESIDTKHVRQKIGAFFIAKGSPKPTHKLTTSILLDPTFAASHRHLLPLFFQLANLVSDNFQAKLASEHGFYSTEVNTKSTMRIIKLSHIFKVAYGTQPNLKDVMETMQGAISRLHRHNGFKRLIVELRHASHNKQESHLPSVRGTYEDTGILIGAEGWHKIATPENCDLLFQHTSIEVKLGKHHITQLFVRNIRNSHDSNEE